MSYIPVSQAHATALKLGYELNPEADASRSRLRGGGEEITEADDYEVYTDSEEYDDDEEDHLDDLSTPAPVSSKTDLGRNTEDPRGGTARFAGDMPASSTGPRYWQYMQGFQGTFPFAATPGAIEAAIRHLLGLVEFDMDRNFVLTHVEAGHSSGDGEHPVVTTMTDRLPLADDTVATIMCHARNLDNHSPCCKWFVHYEGETAPPNWQPTASEEEMLVHIVRDDAPSGLSAYFPLPAAICDDFTARCGKTTYGSFMRTATQVLIGRTDKPGDGHCEVAVYDEQTALLDNAAWMYGGLDLPLAIYKKLGRSVGRATPWALQVRDLDKTAIALSLAGYEDTPRLDGGRRRNYELVTQTDPKEPPQHKNLGGLLFQSAWETVNDMLRGYLRDEMDKTPIEVVVSSLYDTYENREAVPANYGFTFHHPGYLIQKERPQKWARPLAEFLEDMFVNKNHRAFGITLTTSKNFELVPSWRLPQDPTWADYDRLVFGLPEISLDDLRDGIGELLCNHPHPTLGDSIDKKKDVYITLEGVHMSKFSEPITVVITPETTDKEFDLMLTELSTSRVILSLSRDKTQDFAAAVDDAVIWGPRYGDVEAFNYRDWDAQWGGTGEEQDISSEQSLHTNPNTPRGSPTASRGNSPVSKAQKPRKTSLETPAISVPASPKQPSIFNGSGYPAIPVTGPPKESLLRVAGPNVPMVTTKVMTPTEQQRAASALHTERNKILGRAIECHYKDCDFVARADDAAAMEQHLEKAHPADKCPWCDYKFGAHLNQAHKETHILAHHGDKILKIAQQCGVEKGKDGGPPRQSAERKKQREEEEVRRIAVNKPQPSMYGMVPRAPDKARAEEGVYNFCDRCGREHHKFTTTERQWHDKYCVPRAPHVGDRSWCETCGLEMWRTAELSRHYLGDHTSWPHSCNSSDGDDPYAPFCKLCGCPLGGLTEENARAHRSDCKGLSGKVGEFCPYCQVPLSYIRDHKLREMHITSCAQSGKGGSASNTAPMTPYNLYPRSMWEDPRPQPAADEFYSGWRAALKPQDWKPIGNHLRPIRDRLHYADTNQRDSAIENITKKAEELLDNSIQRVPPDELEKFFKPWFEREVKSPLQSSETKKTEPDRPNKRKAQDSEAQDSASQPLLKKRRKSTRGNAISSGDEIGISSQGKIVRAKKGTTNSKGQTSQSKGKSTTTSTEQTNQSRRGDTTGPKEQPAQPRGGSTTVSKEQPAPPRRRSTVTSKESGQPTRTMPKRGAARTRLPDERPKSASPAPAPAEEASVTEKTAEQPEKPVSPAQTDEGNKAGDAVFVPESKMFCSRCFRKVPESAQKPRVGDPTFHEQMQVSLSPLSSRVPLSQT